MKLLTLSVSQPKRVPYHGGFVETGIFKEPVTGRRMIRRINIDGDDQADRSVHGGLDKAVYAYPIENYDYWRGALGRDDLVVPQFGENLTVEGMPEDQVHIGDIFRVGDALLEVAQPRTPCFRLAIKMDDPLFPKRFLESGRVGFYLRVLEEGLAGAGDSITRVHADPARMSVRQISHLYYFDRDNQADAARAAALEALPSGWREPFAQRASARDGALPGP